MAKSTTTVALKGTFDFNEGTITEIVGKGESQTIAVYNLMDVLKQFDECFISVNVKEDRSIPTVEQLVEEDSDEDFDEEEYEE